MTKGTDYRELLIKYIRHVMECEGVSFLHRHEGEPTPEVFTEEEWIELGRLDEEAEKRTR